MQPSLTKKRIETIDLLRGLVMIIMALDHTRDLFHTDAFINDPLNPQTTTPILYFTRWITHFCAPTFVFLSGVSAWLQSRRKTKKELSRFLITRGLWLIFLEVTVMTGMLGDIHFSVVMLATIWAIGISMVILGLFIWLPFRILLIAGLIIVLGHNSLDFAEANRNGVVPLWWSFLHRPTFIQVSSNFSLGVFYPFLPWTGLMILGYCCGKLFSDIETERRNKILLWMGVGALVLFVVLRSIDVYGDPLRWSKQESALRTFFSFMNVQKYPPSLLFICATIGGALIFLAIVKNTRGLLSKIISVYGRVPLFYYVVHFYLIHFISALLYLSRGHSVAEGMKGAPGLPFKFIIPGEGYSLWIVYAVWVAVVIALYPLCKWYDRYKTSHKEKWWLSYL